MTYEYKCGACGHFWTAEQRITAEPIQICPKCQKDTAKRQICNGAFVLKGAGWYRDGY